MHSLVTDGRFSLTMTYKILKVLLKALLVLQETHGYVIISVAVIQLRKECPKKKIIRMMHTDYTKKWLKITFKRWAHLLWKDLISSMFLKIASFWLVTSGGASELSACFRWWEVKNSTSLTNSDSPFISSWISWLEAQINSLLWFFGWFALSRQTCFTYNNFLLYSPSDTSSTLVSGRSPASADSCNRNFNFF